MVNFKKSTLFLLYRFFLDHKFDRHVLENMLSQKFDERHYSSWEIKNVISSF